MNGGFNGKPERDEIYDRALSVLPENPLEGSPATTFNTASTGGTASSSSPIILLVLGVALSLQCLRQLGIRLAARVRPVVVAASPRPLRHTTASSSGRTVLVCV